MPKLGTWGSGPLDPSPRKTATELDLFELSGIIAYRYYFTIIDKNLGPHNNRNVYALCVKFNLTNQKNNRIVIFINFIFNLSPSFECLLIYCDYCS